MRLCVRQLCFSVFLLFTLLGFSNLSHAQSTATIFGRVTDVSGAAIAGAQIFIQPAAGNAAATRWKSGADGTFSAELAPGRYRIRVTAPQMAGAEKEFRTGALDL